MEILIGRDISWIDIIKQVFRVIEFDRDGTIIDQDGYVITTSKFKPYGYLLVESPILNKPVSLPITHRDDFLLAASIYDEPELVKVISKEELLVTYFPKNKHPQGHTGNLHALHYVITPARTLEKYYEMENDKHMSIPEPEKIFDTFIWEGEVKVGINSNPQL